MRAFDAIRAKKLLMAPRPWTQDDFICAGLYFRDYGDQLLDVVAKGRAVTEIFGPREVRLTIEQRKAVTALQVAIDNLHET